VIIIDRLALIIPRTCIVVLVLATAWGLAAGAASANAAERAASAPHGPRFGSATITSEIRTAFDELDEDVYVESLAAGESLRVRVAAAKKSALLPMVEIEGPDGIVRLVQFKVKKGGSLVQSPKLPIDMTGNWVVRIRGDGGTEGAYAAKFKIGRQKSQIFKNVAVGGDAGLTFTQPFEGVEGAIASISITSSKKAARAGFNRVLDPGGGSVGSSEFDIKTKGAKASIKKLELSDGAGAYGVLLTGADGPALVTVKVSLKAPRSRPRGKVVISADEPYLVAVDEPLEGIEGTSFSLRGAHLGSTPRPTVWFGDVTGSVVSAAGDGGVLNVIPPEQRIGTTVAVEVINPDGQAVLRNTYFTYLEPVDDGGPPSSTLQVVAITPTRLEIDGGRTQAFEITINEPAPSGGVHVGIFAGNGIGLVPPTVRIPTAGRTASFLFKADNRDAVGTVVAAYNTSSVTAEITVNRSVVDPPPPGDDTIDISSWVIQQQTSSRSFTIPRGTVLAKGDYLVLGRNASQSAFESTWRVTFGDNVTYLNSVDHQATEVPTINGSETYELRDPFGVTQDGPTIAMSSGARQNLQRIPGTSAGAAQSWSVAASPNTVANPGSGISDAAANNGIYISEFSDRTGTGAYVYEFVELYYDGEPE